MSKVTKATLWVNYAAERLDFVLKTNRKYRTIPCCSIHSFIQFAELLKSIPLNHVQSNIRWSAAGTGYTGAGKI